MSAPEESLVDCLQAVDNWRDLAGELDRALMALTAAIDDWIAALGRKPGEAAGVGDIVARSPGSRRLIRALRRQWLEVAPAALPEADVLDPPVRRSRQPDVGSPATSR